MDRLYLILLTGFGFLSSAIILGALFVLTASFDRYHSESVNEKLDLVLSDWTNTLVASAEDYAFATASYEALNERDNHALSSDLWLAPVRDRSFDWIVILDAEGKVISDLNLPEQLDAAYFSSDTYRAVLDQIAQTAPSEHSSVGGAFQEGGVEFLAATMRITPEDLTDVDASSLAYFIGGRNLDASALSRISASIGSSNSFFTDDIAERSIAVKGPLGSVGNLAWDAELPGSQFREMALPWVLTFCSVLMFVTFWMAAYFQQIVDSFQRMNRVATTDHLTRVANRAGLSEMLQTSFVKQALQGGSLAAISLDLDDFKQLNDEHGHHAGDTALKVAAMRITKSLENNDRVFRMGGDEFLCLVIDPDPRGAAQRIVDRLKNAFNPPIDFDGFDQVVTPSIGVAIADQGENWDDVLERSDAAMYRAKRNEFTLQVCLN